MSVTCFGIDREEILRVASRDAITQTTGRGGEVRVLCLDADDRHILRGVLHDGWVVDRIRGERSIIIDIFYLKEERSEEGEEEEEEEGEREIKWREGQ